jgi:hypothetical protein
VGGSVCHQPIAGPLRHTNQLKLNRILQQSHKEQTETSPTNNKRNQQQKKPRKPTTEPRTTRRAYVTNLQGHIVKQKSEANNSEVINR